METLSLDALNRASLARQHLLERTPATVPRVVEHLVGLQAQEPSDPYVALASRLEGFAPARLGRLLEQRRMVRLTLMRGTLHLVTARDALALRPLLAPAIARGVGLGQRRPQLRGADLDEVAALGRKLLEGEPLGITELGERLAERWPRADPIALARVVQAKVPNVQVTPRGVWGKSGRSRLTTLEAWVGDVAPAQLDLGTLLQRYLAAFGPASAQDMQAWCGLTKLRPIFERAQGLVTFRSPAGETLYDLARAPRPPADTPAPPRFLPVYDNVTLGLRDRARIVRPTARRPTFPPNTWVRFVLLGGVLGATWDLAQDAARATLTVRPFVRVSRDDRAALREEGHRLLAWQAPEAEPRFVLA